MDTTATSRQTRIADVAFDVATQPRQAVTACNLCGGSAFTVVTHRDRYGYATEAQGCRGCGLVFLSPVMTADGYRDFYVGVYRPLVSAYHGRLIDAQTIQAEQRVYAAERATLLEPFLAPVDARSLLDVGGSTGVVAHHFAERFAVEGTVIDPSPLEINEARRLGLETVTGLVEEFDPGGRRFDLVVMCQTIDHLLDVAGTLRAIRRLMSDEGIFFVDIVDFRAAYLRNWSVEEAVKVDHPYYLTEATAEAFLARAGFDILRADYAADHLHVGYVCRPGAAREDALPERSVTTALWTEVRAVQNGPRPGAAS